MKDLGYVPFISWEDYHGNETNLTRLWAHRARKLIYEILLILNSPLDGRVRYDLINDSISCVLGMMDHKIRLRVSIYDITLACVWVIFRRYGIANIDPKSLVNIVQKKLRKKVTLGKFLRTVSLVKKNLTVGLDSNSEIREYIELFMDYIFKQYNRGDSGILKLKALIETNRILDLLDRSLIIGSKHRVLAATIIYYVLRENGYLSIDSATLEKVSGVSRFTILKKYAKIKRAIEVARDSNRS